MLIVTGAAGFIGSALVAKLNQDGFKDLILVDDFSFPDKNKNLEGKVYTEKVERSEFIQWLENNQKLVQGIFHLGARTDTTEFDWDIFLDLNLNYSKDVFNACVKYSIPLVYASSAATYGGGELGYKMIT
jgi:ADP-L-glycero-D-manno-heptose 6-epimerase